MNQTAATLLSIAMLGAFALLFFGAKFALKPETRKNGSLMIAVGAILVANVLIWVV
jgi:hypothetical protein